jgi:hypothetical protein
MVIGFPLVEERDDVGALAMEFRGAEGAIAETESRGCNPLCSP